MPLSKRDFTIKRNDTLPSLRLSIFDRGALGKVEPFDLTGATGVTFTMVDAHGNYKVAKKDGVISCSSGGTIQYNWAAEDTDESGRRMLMSNDLTMSMSTLSFRLHVS